MTTYSPTTEYLINLQERLNTLDVPVFFSMPKDSQEEPFLVIHGTDGTPQDAQSGQLVERHTTLIDIFLPINSRTIAEETRSKAVRALGRQVVSHQLLVDASIGREVYNIKIRVSEII